MNSPKFLNRVVTQHAAGILRRKFAPKRLVSSTSEPKRNSKSWKEYIDKMNQHKKTAVISAIILVPVIAGGLVISKNPGGYYDNLREYWGGQ